MERIMNSKEYPENRASYTSIIMLVPKHRHISPTTVLIAGTLFFLSSFCLLHRIISLKDTSWDILIFTQNWPTAVCDQWMKQGHECRPFPSNTWTIHGIWPTKFGTIGPGFCNKSRPFSPEAIYGIESQLEQYWAPIEKHKKTTALWSHEWLKHGTCAAIVPSLSSEFQYFYQGLEWMKDYNMYSVLEKAGIMPGNQYNITEIWDGVKKVLNKNPQVACYEEAKNISVLLEIRICFNQTLELVDCDGTVVGGPRLSSSYHNLTNCEIGKFVQYRLNSSEILVHKEDSSKDVMGNTYKIVKLFQWLTGVSIV